MPKLSLGNNIAAANICHKQYTFIYIIKNLTEHFAMPIKTDEFCQILAQTLTHEHRFLLNIHQKGIFSIPKSTLQYICGKAIAQAGKQVFEAEPKWIMSTGENKPADKPLVFSYYTQDREKHFLYTDIVPISQDDDLMLQIQPMLQNLQPHKKLVVIILQCTKKQVEVWIEKWTDKIGSILIPYNKAIPVSQDEDAEPVWMIAWQDAIAKETADVHFNADVAMEHAISDMYFESMMLVLKRIISLRTNLDEASLTALTKISTIFKMVFAKEQGVSLDEVYDPEAMAGFTDSELAANNFINDMQKTFHINLNDNEITGILTIKDLAGIIIHKKSR